MDIEFHYYITYLIAARAGFNSTDTHKLAYSCQYVDDNDLVFEISTNTQDSYSNYISQTIDILKPKAKLFRIYPIFHFIPGDPLDDRTRRKDGKLHYLNTTPDSINARKILKQALKSRDIYRIGIACHAYADTWAHKNFVGYRDEFNAMKGLLQRAAPKIGHASAGFNPDKPGIVWTDHRLVDSIATINNKKVFLEAVGRMFEELRSYVQPNCPQSTMIKDKESLVRDISDAIGIQDQKNIMGDHRIRRYKNLALKKEYGGRPLKDYDHDEWMDAAVKEDVRGFRIRSKTAAFRLLKTYISDSITPLKDVYTWKNPKNFTSTDWYIFQEAVKAHQKESMEILYKSTFAKMELEEW